MAGHQDRFSDEGVSQPQHGTESESDHSAEVQLLTKPPNPIFAQPTEVTDVVTARNVKPIVYTPKVMDAGVFADVSVGPVYPTCWDQDPTVATCPKCLSTSLTVTRAVISRTSWFFGGIACMSCGLCLFALACPCCKDIDHFCSNCGCFLGCRSAL